MMNVLRMRRSGGSVVRMGVLTSGSVVTGFPAVEIVAFSDTLGVFS